jgi:hypothetical protein
MPLLSTGPCALTGADLRNGTLWLTLQPVDNPNTQPYYLTVGAGATLEMLSWPKEVPENFPIATLYAVPCAVVQERLAISYEDLRKGFAKTGMRYIPSQPKQPALYAFTSRDAAINAVETLIARITRRKAKSART